MDNVWNHLKIFGAGFETARIEVIFSLLSNDVEEGVPFRSRPGYCTLQQCHFIVRCVGTQCVLHMNRLFFFFVYPLSAVVLCLCSPFESHVYFYINTTSFIISLQPVYNSCHFILFRRRAVLDLCALMYASFSS